MPCTNSMCPGLFQSTLPVGGATGSCADSQTFFYISIHAPRGGSDLDLGPFQTVLRYFNPRSPWGERPMLLSGRNISVIFQSTLPVGGATLRLATKLQTYYISIHAPRGGSDTYNAVTVIINGNFNPRSPWGERLFSPSTFGPMLLFQSTLPVGGATANIGEQPVYKFISIHAPRGGSDYC